MSLNPREIVSLQVGHFSNFVGTHWWNIQESCFVYSASETDKPKEVNNDILFREGQTLHGDVTYTPRLVSFDLKGSLNTLRQEGMLYEVQDIGENILWKSDVTLHKTDVASPNDYLKDLAASVQQDIIETEEPEKESDTDEHRPDIGEVSMNKDSDVFGTRYYDLDDQVSVWSDFLKLHLHPKSVAMVEEYRHGTEEQRFDVFGHGQEVYSHRDTKLDFEDRLHFFLEDCDNLQGLHVLADCYDGFGGLTSSMVEELSDDYSNKSVVVYSLCPAVFPNDSISRECHRAVNSLLSYDSLVTHSSAFIPLSMTSELWRSTGPPTQWPHLNYKPELMYHTSALLAASLENLSLPYRLQSNSSLMNHMYESLATGGRKVLSAHSCFPLALRTNQNMREWLLQSENTPPWQSLTAGCRSEQRATAQSVVMRGLTADRITGPTQLRSPASVVSRCDSVEEVMQQYLSETLHTNLNSITSIISPLPTVAPFPHVFSDKVSYKGHLEDKLRPLKQGVSEVAMMTSLQCNQDVSTHLNCLHKVCQRFNIKKFHRFLESGLEEDLYRQSLDNLASLIQSYGGRSKEEADDSDDE